MKVLDPIAVTDANLVSSSATEDDAPLWNSGTTYIRGNRVISTTTHRVYQSAVDNNTGNNPDNDAAGAFWLIVGSTRKWRAFDQSVGEKTTHTGVLSYRVTVPKLVNAIALLRLSAFKVRVQVVATDGTITYDRTRELGDYSEIVDALTMVTVEPVGADFAAFENFAALPGQDVIVSIGAAGLLTEVGELVIGQSKVIGTTLDGTSIGLTDYSKKERDDFGNVYIVPRAYSDNTSFEVAITTGNAKKIKRLLTGLRSKIALYYSDAEDVYGTAVYGFYRDIDIPLESQGISFANIEIEGLT